MMLSEILFLNITNKNFAKLQLDQLLQKSKACADPEIFMRGGLTKMVIFGHRRGGGGGSNPQKIPKLPFFFR